MNLVYIGDKYIQESCASMSSLYQETGERSDWGKVTDALRNGERVSIRPASLQELENADRKLNKIKKSMDVNSI